MIRLCRIPLAPGSGKVATGLSRNPLFRLSKTCRKNVLMTLPITLRRCVKVPPCGPCRQPSPVNLFLPRTGYGRRRTRRGAICKRRHFRLLHCGKNRIGRTQCAWYNAIMNDISPQLLDEIVRRLVEALQPEEIYLFGSHASGTPHRHSDLDLLVVVPDDAGDRHQLAARGYLALYGIRTPVDLVVQCRADIGKWASVKPSLPYEATQKGKRIYAAAVGVGA